jgi:uncharacterized GH25 family protein
MCILLVVGVLIPTGARSHEFWLCPSAYRASAGSTVEILAFVGTGFRGDALPYSPARTVRFEVRSPARRDLRAPAVNGDPCYARIVLPDRAGAVVTYLSDFTQIELPADEFDRYLALEGLDETLAARKLSAVSPPGRERFRRCAKTWIAGEDASIVTRAYELPCEIVPLADPTLPSSDLAVRVLCDGRPTAGALVRAWRQPAGSGSSPIDAAKRDSIGPSAECRSDSDGIAHLRIDRAGEWLVSAVHMTAARRPHNPAGDASTPDADWESSWASLTFLREEDAP